MSCLIVLLCVTVSCGSSVAMADDGRAAAPTDHRELGWVWPAPHFQLTRPFVQPAHAYGPGHRGVDLDLMGESRILAPADGVIAFAGAVAGRMVVTIDHGDDLVTTLEPVQTTLAVGTAVQSGEAIGLLGAGGHSAQGSLHFGVRLRGEYISPLVLLGGIARAILLPCCE